MSTTLESPRLSDDASAILLLCATLAQRRRSGEPALSVGDYSDLMESLRARSLRPGSLLRTDRSTLTDIVASLPPKSQARLSTDRIEQLLERGGQLALALSKWSSMGLWILTRADAAYPSRYKQKLGRSAPPIIFGIGPQEFLEMGGLAVAGSRDLEPSSEEYTTQVGEWAASSGIQIVSGAARGVDAISMTSCSANGGRALGVVAESLIKLSTRRDFRDHIIAQRMTLVSSYDPEAGFSPAAAMGRNRWVYALADCALVVASSEGSGGTWAGAVEALKKRDVRVFVRTGNPDRPGNEALLQHGALPAPTDLSEMFRERATPSNAVKTNIAAGDVFAAATPIIVAFLQNAATQKDVAEALDLTPSQAKLWLTRLCESGTIHKSGTLYRSVVAGESRPSATEFQMRLLDGP